MRTYFLLQLQQNAFLLCQSTHNLQLRLHLRYRSKGARMNIYLACLNLGVIQNISNDTQQGATGIFDDLQVLQLYLIQLGAFEQVNNA